MKTATVLPKDYCAFVIVNGLVGVDGIPLMTEKGFKDEKWKLFGGRPKEIDRENGILRPEYTAMREVTEEAGIFLRPLDEPFLVIPKINSQRKEYDFIVFIGWYSHGELRPAGAEVKEVKSFLFEEIEEMVMKDKIVRDHDKALKKYMDFYREQSATLNM